MLWNTHLTAEKKKIAEGSTGKRSERKVSIPCHATVKHTADRTRRRAGSSVDGIRCPLRNGTVCERPDVENLISFNLSQELYCSC